MIARACGRRKRTRPRIRHRLRVRELPPELLTGPFTVRRAAELGIPEHVLRSSRFRTPVRGVRVPSHLPATTSLNCAAHALVLPSDAAFSHATALALHDLPLPLAFRDRRVHVSVPSPRSVPALSNVAAHAATWVAGDVRRLAGLRVTAVERTICDLAAAGWPLVDLVVIADAGLRRGRWITREQLAERVRRWAGQRGARRLRNVLVLAETAVDSPMETRLRLLLLAAGLPRPAVNRPVHADEDGAYLHTPDLSWPAWRVAVDYDGAHHFAVTGPDGDWRRRQDIARQEVLQEHGWVLRIMTATDVLRRPELAVERTRQALRARGAPMITVIRGSGRWWPGG
jgi:hypothetical protein